MASHSDTASTQPGTSVSLHEGEALPNFIDRLTRDGVKLWVEEGRLRYSGPSTVLSAAMLDRIRSNKEAICTLLSGNRFQSPELPHLSITKKPWRPLVPLHIQRHWRYAMAGQGGMAIIPRTLRFKTIRPDIDAFAESFAELASRHAILSTTARECRGKGMLDFGAAGKPRPEMKIIDLSDVAEDRVTASVGQAIHQPFDLSTGVPIRALLFKLPQNEVVFSLVGSHVIADAIAMNVLFGEFWQIARARLRKESTKLPEIALEYADYATCLEEFAEPQIRQHAAVWQDLLSGTRPTCLVPDFEQELGPEGNGGFESFCLDERHTEELRLTAARHHVSLFALLLAAHNIALHRVARTDDVTVGVFHSGRDSPLVERMIGQFGTKYYYRTRFTPGDRLRQIVESIWNATTFLQGKGLLPLDVIVERLAIELGPQLTPSFVYVANGTPREGTNHRFDVASPGATRVRWRAHHVEIEESARSLRGTIRFRTDRYSPITIRRFVDEYVSVLTKLCGDLDCKLDAL